VALNAALLVNAAILILAASTFHKRGIVVTEIQQAYEMLTPLLGTTAASVVFAIALLCAGQSSTLTGTLAGQIVMEGFLNFRVRPWLRRLVTRLIAIVPAMVTILIAGEQGTYRLLILSQVILSMQLPFAIIPLIHFTSDRRRMGSFANAGWVRALSWLTAAVIVALNVRLAAGVLADWVAGAGEWRFLVMPLVIAVSASLGMLLLWVAFEPLLTQWIHRFGRAPVTLPAPATGGFEAPVYRRILVPLDHTDLDRRAIAHAASLARAHGARLHLIHVEEGVTSQVYGPLASDAEVQAGRRYLDEIVSALRKESIDVESEICYSTDPRKEIVRYAREVRPDLVIMGAHGHRRLKDLIFGNTIDPVRHDLDVPMLIVRDGG
jgi:manganese transport protein